MHDATVDSQHLTELDKAYMLKHMHKAPTAPLVTAHALLLGHERGDVTRINQLCYADCTRLHVSIGPTSNVFAHNPLDACLVGKRCQQQVVILKPCQVTDASCCLRQHNRCGLRLRNVVNADHLLHAWQNQQRTAMHESAFKRLLICGREQHRASVSAV